VFVSPSFSKPELFFALLDPVASCAGFFPIRGGALQSLGPEAFIHLLLGVVAHAQRLPQEAAGMAFFESADHLEASCIRFR